MLDCGLILLLYGTFSHQQVLGGPKPKLFRNGLSWVFRQSCDRSIPNVARTKEYNACLLHTHGPLCCSLLISHYNSWHLVCSHPLRDAAIPHLCLCSCLLWNECAFQRRPRCDHICDLQHGSSPGYNGSTSCLQTKGYHCYGCLLQSGNLGAHVRRVHQREQVTFIFN